MKDVTAALLLKDGSCLIAKRNAKDPLANLWEFPGGKIEAGESPQECLQREMKEEFGIDVEVGEFLTESVYEYDRGAIRLLAYWVKWRYGALQPTVHDDNAWVNAQTIDDYLFAPADIPIAQILKKYL